MNKRESLRQKVYNQYERKSVKKKVYNQNERDERLKQKVYN